VKIDVGDPRFGPRAERGKTSADGRGEPAMTGLRSGATMEAKQQAQRFACNNMKAS